jgi:hypothetical protein
LQMLKIIPVIAAVTSKQALGVSLGVCRHKKIRHNPVLFAPALQIGAKLFPGKNCARL